MLLGCAPLKQGKRVVGLKKQEDLDFPGGPKVKNLPDSAEDNSTIPTSGRVHMSQGN